MISHYGTDFILTTQISGTKILINNPKTNFSVSSTTCRWKFRFNCDRACTLYNIFVKQI